MKIWKPRAFFLREKEVKRRNPFFLLEKNEISRDTVLTFLQSDVMLREETMKM